MAYKALYREWRPRTFNDVVGQEHITTTLKNQILNERTAHAYLFCGTRGTGKTSTAKVMAKALNCLDLKDGEPCNECEMCKKINEGLAIDITELDAASNNGVDNIRDIIDDVQYPPQEARFKVYIMDEVHMLSMGAVNAFLKTLEEPPKNVVFILATTDPQKLPITILSRCQRFDFKRISRKDITGRLRKIVTEQGIFCDDRSLELVARVKSQLRRYDYPLNRENTQDLIVIKDLTIDTVNKQVALRGENIKLTATEYKILTLLASHPGRIFSIKEIYERVWEEPFYKSENTVTVHIRRMREKIEINSKEPEYIKVVWGLGYKIDK